MQSKMATEPICEEINGLERRKLWFNKNTDNTIKLNAEWMYKPKDSDLMIVGPPKSGTTWMQQILHQIRSKGDESFDDLFAVTRWIPNPTTALNYNINEDQGFHTRVFKHHEAFGVIETTEKQKTIIIFRNPYDAAYSWMKFIDRYFGADKDVSDLEMSQLMTALHESQWAGNFVCMSSWFEHRNDQNVMLIFYEDLKADLPMMIRKIAGFFNVQLTEEELNKIADHCSFQYMSVDHKEKFRGDAVTLGIACSLNIEKWQQKTGMVREDGGKVGDGSKVGPQLRATIDRLWAETMEEKFGFKTYEELYDKYSNLK